MDDLPLDLEDFALCTGVGMGVGLLEGGSVVGGGGSKTVSRL